jgi:hypothetical protein
MIARQDERLAQSIGISVRLTRRALLTRTAALAAAWTVSPWAIGARPAFGWWMDPSSTTQTLEAFSDTLIPGEKRFPADRAIAGVVSGAGAVQAGAIEMLHFPPVGFQAALPGLAATINVLALLYALEHKIALGLTVPPLVDLDFASRTALLVRILDSEGPEQAAFYGLASVVFVAYNTAGYLPTAEAIRAGHLGLAAIRFPPPDPDGVWRFPDFSYRRVLAQAHPLSSRGNPA